ncbi:PREDICTED: sushi, von Willebrand factor type A, EGF and pentraxin domain-containing protein 1-like [Priapulus caudatus]|uniref:Sushi, von Willebrand factor type A, EGF and pentraxin domain-containing protein 1-like n=1 Tax=Priapulus caudatus TaxID=37621 RepID=A0ABM1DUQ1_PRICU|nr:PREDICTED: sushi, von Willebrand factor type A, EGF and pentraxin domain-containing protein 1-like [Priapulus caudatus]
MPVDCASPPLVAHAHAEWTSTHYGDEVTYACDQGFTMSSNRKLFCSAEGEWMALGQRDGTSETPAPTCERLSCPTPAGVSHAARRVTGYNHGDKAQYSCQPGYEMTGASILTCDTNALDASAGSWDHPAPVCDLVTCSHQQPPTHGQVSGDNMVGSTATYTCDDGYRLSGAATRLCRDTGDWSDPAPMCILSDCGPPKQPLYTRTLSPDGYMTGEKVTFTCLPGYRAVQHMSTTCQQDGHWTHLRGMCTRMSCGRPPINNGAVLLGASHYIGDHVIVTCPPGKKAINSVLVCTEQGTWSGRAFCSAHCAAGCRNGGVCIRKNQCLCPPGFHGQSCEQAMCIFPCMHGGTCIAPFKCSCSLGWTGARCQQAICDPNCKNGGHCIAPNTCMCPSGKISQDCRSIEMTEAQYYMAKEEQQRYMEAK